MAKRIAGRLALVTAPREARDRAAVFVKLVLVAGEDEEVAELGERARPAVERMIRELATDNDEQTVAELVLDLFKIAERPLHTRLETLAAFLSLQTDDPVRIKVMLAARLLPLIAPELPYKYDVDDFVLGRPSLFPPSEAEREQARDAIYKWAFDHATDEPGRGLERLVERNIFQTIKLPPANDGRAIVKAAARYLGVPKEDAKNLFAAGAVHESREKKKRRAAKG